MANLIVAADICPIGNNRELLLQGDAAGLFNDLRQDLDEADLVVANLECPLIEKPAPIPKRGPVFGAPPECIKGIAAGGVDVLGLANNHILDHGEEGLACTLKTCRQAGIKTVGAGENIAAASQLLIQNIKGVRVAILALAENEFTIATEKKWGANPLDLIRFVRTVTQRRSEYDFLVVLYHGGDEFIVPTPKLQETCRFMVEMGAGAVLVQHPHTLGGYERYRGGHIVYGQGAFIMDEEIYRSMGSFHDGFLVRLDVRADGTSEMDFIPFRQSDPEPGARKLSPQEGKLFLEKLAARAKQVADPNFVAEEWRRYCLENQHSYLSILLGHNRVLARLNRWGLLERWAHGQQAILGARNMVCCETHREALTTIFEDWLNERGGRL